MCFQLTITFTNHNNYLLHVAKQEYIPSSHYLQTNKNNLESLVVFFQNKYGTINKKKN